MTYLKKKKNFTSLWANRQSSRAPQRLSFGPKILKIYIWPTEAHCLRPLIADFFKIEKGLKLEVTITYVLFTHHKHTLSPHHTPHPSIIHTPYPSLHRTHYPHFTSISYTLSTPYNHSMHTLHPKHATLSPYTTYTASASFTLSKL